MDEIFAKTVRSFLVAKAVVHYYWIHTDGDDHGKTSVENIQTIIARLTGLKIEKYLVDFEGSAVRGNLERYDDRAVIHVRKTQTEEEQRFVAVKELFHLLADEKSEFST